MKTRLLALALCCVSLPAWAAAPDADAILASGKLDEGVASLTTYLESQPKDDVARFGLGAVQFVQSAQNLSQKLAVYHPQTLGNAEFEQLLGEVPVPKESLTYPRLRQIAQEWLVDLARVDSTLAMIKSEDVKLPLHFGRISMTLSRSGAQSLTIVPFFLQQFGTNTAQEQELVIAFDRADVDWLRGYCHLMSAVGEISLAYDGQELFDVFGHRVFKHIQTPHMFLLEGQRFGDSRSIFEFEMIADIIAAIHVLRFPVVEPKRTPVALAHIEQALGLSRQMWKRILAEADNDREWIPNPKQASAINVSVTQEMVDNWTVALDETESILQGKKLLPFWRGKRTRGVNLRKAFLEPRPLDIVLWVQGTAATPYLEEGELTKPDTWRKINQAFRGQLFSFGVWFN